MREWTVGLVFQEATGEETALGVEEINKAVVAALEKSGLVQPEKCWAKFINFRDIPT